MVVVVYGIANSSPCVGQELDQEQAGNKQTLKDPVGLLLFCALTEEGAGPRPLAYLGTSELPVL